MGRRNLTLLAGGLGVALLVVVLLAPNASSDPDGLERVAAVEGFAGEADDAGTGLLAGYSVPGVEDETATRILAGTIGTLAAALLALGGGALLRRRARRRERERSGTAAASPEQA